MADEYVVFTANVAMGRYPQQTHIGIFKSFQVGEQILIRFDNEPILNTTVSRFVLTALGDRFTAEMKSLKEDVQRLLLCNPIKLDGKKAKFGPSMAPTIPRATLEDLMKGMLSKVAGEEDPTRANLLKLMWGDADVDTAPVLDANTLSLVERHDGGTMTSEQTLASAMTARMQNEVVVVSACAGAGKTDVGIQALLMMKEALEIFGEGNRPDEFDGVVYIGSTMNEPLSGLAEKVVGRNIHLKFVIIQSAATMGKKSTADNYNQFRFPVLLQELYDEPCSAKWTRAVTAEERLAIQAALNDCARIFADFDADFERVPAVDKEKISPTADYTKLAMEILLDVYRPFCVVGTLTTVMRYQPVLKRIKWIMLDEAGTVSTAAAIQLIMYCPRLAKITAIGDVKQMHTKDVEMPPEILPLGFGSVLLALNDSPAVQKVELTITFRLSSKMVGPVSDFCYEGKMKGGIECVGISELLPWPNNITPHDILVIDVPGTVEFSLTRSRGNASQAAAAAVFGRFFAANHPLLNVATLSFYTLQLQMNKNEMASSKVDNVDRNQGSEFDVVLLTTTVQCGDNDKVAFIDDARRMTVALTRAKKGLVIFADVASLRSGTVHWAKLWDVLAAHGVPVLGLDFVEEMAKVRSQDLVDVQGRHIASQLPSVSGTGLNSRRRYPYLFI